MWLIYQAYTTLTLYAMHNFSSTALLSFIKTRQSDNLEVSLAYHLIIRSECMTFELRLSVQKFVKGVIYCLGRISVHLSEAVKKT